MLQTAGGFAAGGPRSATDAHSPRSADHEAMTYAVTWRENGGPEYVGKLDLDGDCVELSGAAPGHRKSSLHLDAAELSDVQVRRRPGTLRAERPILVFVGRDGREVCLTPLQGLGVIHEIADRIANVRGNTAV